MYEIQVTTALPRPRYFVVEMPSGRVAGSVFGHLTMEGAQAELARIANAADVDA